MIYSQRSLLDRSRDWHERVHLEEFRQICDEKIKENNDYLLNQFENKIDSIADSIIGAVHTDIRTILRISFRDAKEMFEDKRTQEFISNSICDAFARELKRQLKDIIVK